VAVQLRVGLLSKRRLRTHSFDRADPLADGADLITPPPISPALLAGSVLFSSIAQTLNTIMRLFDLDELT
jgi:hypothetical protein